MANARITAAQQWLAGFGAAWLLLTNAYYRGLVYVVCGPRQKREQPATL